MLSLSKICTDIYINREISRDHEDDKKVDNSLLPYFLPVHALDGCPCPGIVGSRRNKSAILTIGDCCLARKLRYLTILVIHIQLKLFNFDF